MSRLRVRPGGLLFWLFFVPYTVGVTVFLVAGLAPSIAKEFGSVHETLHDVSGDALRADSSVTIAIENHDPATRHRLAITTVAGSERLIVNEPVPSHLRDTMEFVAPPAGTYRLISLDDPEMQEELRFAPDGSSTLAVRISAEHHQFERFEAGWWPEVSRRVADASHRADHGGRVTLETLSSVLNLGLGILLIVRRPRDRTARLLAVAMIGTAAMFNHQAHSTVRDYLVGDWWVAHDLFHLMSGVAYLYAVVVFPDGRLLPFGTRHRVLLRVAYGFATVLLAGMVLDGTTEGHPGQPFFTVLFGLLIPFVGVASQTYRLRRATEPVVHQQSRLLRWALLPMLFGGALYFVLTRLFHVSWMEDVGLAVFPALFALVPVALVMGILRYRLWDIDVLISRTLLSVGLAAFIGSVYVVVVVLLGHGLGPGESAGMKILATAIVAVAFEPVRERLSRFANRLVYGARATPYEVLADFSDRMANAISVEEILPRIAEAAVSAVGGAAGRVTVFLPGGGSNTVQWPPDVTISKTVTVTPVDFGGVPVGEIAVATMHDERLRPDEENLLTALAAQAGLAVNNARLTIELSARLDELSTRAAELQASRLRIVTARQIQRQRVVQLIHDRVEVRLDRAFAMMCELESEFGRDAERSLQQIDGLLEECGTALDAMRDLAHGIFPAILSDQGLVCALEAYVLQSHLALDVELDCGNAPESYDPQVEATVYFCMIQALANAAEYAPGSSVVAHVRAEDGNLAFSVSDNGPGVRLETLHAGADIRDMRDRVEAFGGTFDATSTLGIGTRISGSVPTRTLAEPSLQI